jgi:hypothetical protein
MADKDPFEMEDEEYEAEFEEESVRGSESDGITSRFLFSIKQYYLKIVFNS